MGSVIMSKPRNIQNNNLFNHIPLMKPWLGDDEVEELRKVVISGWISQGTKVEEFEKMVASFTSNWLMIVILVFVGLGFIYQIFKRKGK